MPDFVFFGTGERRLDLVLVVQSGRERGRCLVQILYCGGNELSFQVYRPFRALSDRLPEKKSQNFVTENIVIQKNFGTYIST